MKILYFDCFAGAAGDMILGALLDAGLPLAELKRGLGSLAVEGWDVSVERVIKAGITATRFRVHEHAHPPSLAHAHASCGEAGSGHQHQHEHEHQGHRSLEQIFAAINRSALGAAGKACAIAMFRRLGEVEAAIHGTSIDQVHLHEVGAIDSIIDIVGAVFALEWFNADRIVVSPINAGGGMVTSAHGVFPVPAPATLALLKDVPVYSSGIQQELLTPTGALILTEYANEFGPIPPMRITAVGYGAGDRELKDTPNVVRVLVGEAIDKPKGLSPPGIPSVEPPGIPLGQPQDTASRELQSIPNDTCGDQPLGVSKSMKVAVLECEIDDMNPQIFGVLMDRLYAAGALEVFYSAVQMKKNRPGTLMTIVTKPEQREGMIDIVFRESTTIGIRHQELSRECLDRTMVMVTTSAGPVRFKVASRDGRVLNAQPEFDDLVKLSEQRGIPIKDLQALAHKAWLER